MSYSQLISINSQNRSAGTTTNFTAAISPTIAKPTSATLLWANIPYTFYNIQAGVNDKLSLGDPIAGSVSITIPAQNYSAPALATILSSLLTAAGGFQSYAVSYSPNTFKLTITATTAFTLDFSVANSCAKVLGFNATVTASATSHTGNKVIDLTASNLFIDIAEFSSGVYSTHTPHTFIVPIDVNPGATIQLQAPPSISQTVTVPAPLYQLTVRLLTANGDIVDLNGAEWQLLLKVDYTL